MNVNKKENALEVKKIDKKIKLDTTMEGWFDCGDCLETVWTTYYNIQGWRNNVGCQFEIRRSKKMISDLLSLTKEDAIIKLNISEINIKSFIKDICIDYIDIANMQDKEFDIRFNLKKETLLVFKSVFLI